MIRLQQAVIDGNNVNLTGVYAEVDELWVLSNFKEPMSLKIISAGSVTLPMDVWDNLNLPDIKDRSVVATVLDFKETCFVEK